MTCAALPGSRVIIIIITIITIMVISRKIHHQMARSPSSLGDVKISVMIHHASEFRGCRKLVKDATDFSASSAARAPAHEETSTCVEMVELTRAMPAQVMKLASRSARMEYICPVHLSHKKRWEG
eukprot:3740187-Amphidinium_carterae.1